MPWVNWSRRTTAGNPGTIGMEISASHARAAAASAADNRLIPLEAPHLDLPLAINLERRTPVLGRAGSALLRLLPLAVCDEFLPFLGKPREWRSGRHRFDAAAAVSLLFETLRPQLRDCSAVYLGLPGYLDQKQAGLIAALAAKSRFPLAGTVPGALALAVEHCGPLVAPPLTEIEKRIEGIVPLYRTGKRHKAADALVIDADDYALTFSLVRLEPGECSLRTTTSLPEAGVKRWKKTLLDCFADRCIRVCRRDPRDSAEAEQSLYEQIDESIDRVRAGEHVVLATRAAHWYQDLHLRLEDFVSCCTGIVQSCLQGLRKLLDPAAGEMSSDPKSPSEAPRIVWMTHEAGRLPGLADAIRQNVPEKTYVSVLSPESVAIAVANLGERWPAAAGTHLDPVVPMPVAPESKPLAPIKKTGGGRQ